MCAMTLLRLNAVYFYIVHRTDIIRLEEMKDLSMGKWE